MREEEERGRGRETEWGRNVRDVFLAHKRRKRGSSAHGQLFHCKLLDGMNRKFGWGLDQSAIPGLLP
jgi:hypothetical protein